MADVSQAVQQGLAQAMSNESYRDDSKKLDVRTSNILAGKAVASLIRTSLGPRGMDKLIQSANGDVVITNDGATILKTIRVIHPAARMLVDLSASQDIEAGDGTTTVVVLAGAFLDASLTLLNRGIHPTAISDAFGLCADEAEAVMTSMAIPVSLGDREAMTRAAVTSLGSKVVSQYSGLLAPMAVECVLRVIDPETARDVDLRDIRVVKKVGGTIDDTEIVDGLVFDMKVSHAAGGPTRIENAKIGLAQFCLSSPKSDMESSVVVSDYQQMDRILKEERSYILNLCKQIKKAGCNVLLLQKSILRDAVNDLSLHFLAKMGILVVRDIERDEIEFISRATGAKPVASIEGFTADKLGSAALVQEVSTGDGRVVKCTGTPGQGRTVSVFVRGSNRLVIDEAERSLHDALCVVRSMVKNRFLIPGGSAPEIEVSRTLMERSKTLAGKESICMRTFAEALEVIPATLAENAGLHAITIVTELRNRHQEGDRYAGVNVRRACISDMREENVLQPLLVSVSAMKLAVQTVRHILRVDDLLQVM
eukprot:TRINITY_DN31_c0_g1_i1.p1 TRINITY_DN31_c0_g1~~TRINITY_DN31_c0_g1_i1.p1  ORF type:complete len:538 (-),score=188.99 TRINITY_DN31_c0_g1_i1:30-1643(-)